MARGHGSANGRPPDRNRTASLRPAVLVADHLTLNDETAQGPFRTRGMGRWVALGIGGPPPVLSPSFEGKGEAPVGASRFVGCAYYGVGNEPPRMSLLPKLAGQSACGAGFGTEPPTWNDCRNASIAGQSAASRVSFQTAAPYVLVATA